MPSMFEILRRNRLRWLGHVYRMGPERLPKKVLYGQLSTGTRTVGRPKLRYKDVCKRSLNDFHINADNYEDIAEDRIQWRNAVWEGMRMCSADRDQQEQLRRERRHQSVAAAAARAPAVEGGFVCGLCQRVCLSRIGLCSHERACRRLNVVVVVA